jgi:hypothetical protein
MDTKSITSTKTGDGNSDPGLLKLKEETRKKRAVAANHKALTEALKLSSGSRDVKKRY